MEAKSMEIKRKKQAKKEKNPTCRLMRYLSMKRRADQSKSPLRILQKSIGTTVNQLIFNLITLIVNKHVISIKPCYKEPHFAPKIWRQPKSPYLCSVFFIVLDLRLTKDWLSGIDSLFLCPYQKLTPNKQDISQHDGTSSRHGVK